LREIAYYTWLLLTYIVINTLLGRVTRHPAGMHCPAGDDAYVSSLNFYLDAVYAVYIHGIRCQLRLCDCFRVEHCSAGVSAFTQPQPAALGHARVVSHQTDPAHPQVPAAAAPADRTH